jgi:signal transduction histidine kinase
MVLHRQLVSVAEVLGEAMDMVEALGRDKRIALRTEIAAAPGNAPTAPGVTVLADRDIVRRVLVNLLGNALKFTPEGGSITVGAEPQQGPGETVCVWVRDTGPGIAPEHQGRIFDKFYQVRPGATAGGVASTGLGLSFCRMAVEAHGGRIGVDSEPGQGSRFWFTLPAAE